jgi:hypothetical protein
MRKIRSNPSKQKLFERFRKDGCLSEAESARKLLGRAFPGRAWREPYGTAVSRYEDKQDILASWKREKADMESRLASLAVKEAAARHLLASDAPPSLKRNGEAVLADCQQRRAKIEELLGRCDVAVADLTRELKSYSPHMSASAIRTVSPRGWQHWRNRCDERCCEVRRRPREESPHSRLRWTCWWRSSLFGSLFHSHAVHFSAALLWCSTAGKV